MDKPIGIVKKKQKTNGSARCVQADVRYLANQNARLKAIVRDATQLRTSLRGMLCNYAQVCVVCYATYVQV